MPTTAAATATPSARPAADAPSTQPDASFGLAVDLGTCNTVAVLRWPDGRTRPLLVGGAPIMASGIFADEAGQLHVGRDALRLAQLDPARFEPNPKRRIDDQTVLLGDHEVAVVDLLAAILAAVAQAAVEAVGFLPAAVLTHPATWGPRRRELLLAAAARAGWPPVRLAPEPVAAARYFADVLRRPIPAGAALAVFDFGGGTIDLAVVRNDKGHFSVLGSAGIEDLGGLDIDAGLIEHLGTVLAQRVPGRWQALARPQGVVDRRDRRLFWDDVRGAKEMLSRTAVAQVAVPGVAEPVHLTRDELERVATPLLRRAVSETDALIRRCGLQPYQLAGLFLVGGSSRLPLVARLLHADLGVAPTVLEQPEFPVAEGALAELVPVAAQAPVAAPAGDPAGSSADGGESSPVSPGPAPAGPPGGSAPASPSGGSPPPGASRAWYRRRLAWISAAVILVAAVVAAAVLVRAAGDQAVRFTSLEQVGGAAVGIAEASGVYETFTYTIGDIAVVGWVQDKALHVGAIDLKKGRPAWSPRTVAEADRWQTLIAVPQGVVAIGDNYDSPRRMYLLSLSDGAEKWHRDLQDGDYPLYYESKLVLVSPRDELTRGLDWQTGDQRWSIGNPTNEYGSLRTYVFAPGSSADSAGPARYDGRAYAPDLAADQRLLMVDTAERLHLFDVRNGHDLGSRSSVGEPDDDYLAFDHKLYVAGSRSPYRVQAYNLDKAGEPQVIYTAPDDRRRLQKIAPCGTGRICLLDSVSSDTKTAQVAAIDVASSRQLWRRDAAGAEALAPVGDRILATSTSGDPVSLLFDPTGRQLLRADDQRMAGARVGGASLLLFSQRPSTQVAEISLLGVDAREGSRQPLGALPKVRAGACSWNERFLVCPAEAQFQVWRFAE